MRKKVFSSKKPTIKNYKNYAVVDGKNYSYIDGYYEAANSLVDIAIESPTYKRNILFYPICYNYRHYLELQIKSLIIDIEKCCIEFDLCEGIFEKISDKLDNSHNLNDLLENFISRFNSFSDEKFPNDIRKYIRQMHDTDKNGQKYRYHKGRNKKFSFPNEEQYDLKNISNIMGEVHQLLVGVDCYIDNCIDAYNDMRSEYEASMRSEM